MRKIFWLAGEPSGDLHASFVMQKLNEHDNELEHYGVGGYRMAHQGLKQLYPFKQFNVMGFIEVVKHLNFFNNVENGIAKWLEKNKPDLVVLVDYPGLNLRIAKIAHELRIKVFYYISPTVWAWKHNRVKKLKKYCEFVACILPFEEDYLVSRGVHAKYVGNPVAEEITVTLSKEEFAEKYGLDVNKKWIGFMPGSRDMEIKRLLPEYLHAVEVFNDDTMEYLFSLSSSVDRKLFMRLFDEKKTANCHLIFNDNYNLMKHSYVACVTSGTATLEAALIGNPFIIVYKTSQTSYSVGRRVIKLEYIGLPNLIMGVGVVPELIQNNAKGFSIYRTLQDYINSPDFYVKKKKQLEDLHKEVGDKSASKETANHIREILY